MFFSKTFDQKHFAQGTIEYLVILAVIVVIGLVLVTISANFLDSQTELGVGSQNLANQSSSIVVREAIIDNEGTALLSLENKFEEELTLDKIVLEGEEVLFNTTLFSGASLIFSMPSLSCVCSSGEITKECTYEIYTTSRYGLTKKELVTVNLNCVDDATSDNPIVEPTYPINGECGSAIESAFLIAPTTNLCASGNATTVNLSETNLEWEWSCNGINDGENSETCSAERYLGAGLEEDPFIIIDCQGLQNINLALDANYILGKDIDCQGIDFEPIGTFDYCDDSFCGDKASCEREEVGCGSEWYPEINECEIDKCTNEISCTREISCNSVWNEVSFKGNLNGNNYTINNLNINKSNRDYVGVFGSINNGKILNLRLENSNIIGDRFIGGLIGYQKNSQVLNSYFKGNISGNGWTGGLVGQQDNSFISNSYSEGTIIGQGYYTGGIVGQQYNSSSIYNSYTTGNITGNRFTGGVVGQQYNSSSIYNSYTTGNITGTTYVGGVVGGHQQSSNIYNSFSTGIIAGNYGFTGGITASQGNAYTHNSYWDITLTNQNNCYSGGDIGCTSTNNNESWYFNPINAPLSSWTWGEDGNWTARDNNYPILTWQTE